MFTENLNEDKKIRPSLLFSGNACGLAEDAVDFYTSVFINSEKGFTNRYENGEASDTRAKINFGEVNIEGTQFTFMDHGFGGDFTFNEAFSFMVLCENQEEIDYYWNKLSYVPEAEQCGWLKDKFGLSWQIVPSYMSDMLFNGTEEELKRVTEAFLKMKKFDLKTLKKARLGQVD